METEEQRTARLDRLSANQSGRLAMETEEQRTARLERLSANQRGRLSTESSEQRELRLQSRRQSHEIRLSTPLLKQRPVRTKMLKFHQHLATLQVPTCITCSKGFPGLKMSTQSSECFVCSRDKDVPKLYCSLNNMDPGPIPPQLKV